MCRSTSCRPEWWLALALVLPVPALAARLIGTLSGEAPLAVLALDSGGERLLEPGESVDGCRLLRVDAGRAMFDCGSGRRDWTLERGQPLPVSSSAQSTLPVAAPSARQLPSASLPQSLLSAWRASPQQLLSELSLQPLVVGGAIQAYRLERLSAMLAETTGLRAGDLIERVDGLPLSEAAAVLESLRGAAERGQIHIALRRDEQPLSLLILL